MGKTNKQNRGSRSNNPRNNRNADRNGSKRGTQSELDYKGPYRGGNSNPSGATPSRGNPVEYYTKFSDYAIDAAKIPMSTPLGAEYQPGFYFDEDTTYRLPGLMRIMFYPSIGVSRDFTSPMNRSSIRFYTYLRSNQKASALYDHQDVTMMMVAMDSAYMYHAYLTRIYKVLNTFTPVNEYYPKTLVSAMGANYDDLRAHIQDFRAYINNFAYNLGQYALPKNVSWFDRHRWMCEGLYVDSETTRAQTYMFVPAGFYKYDNTVETGSMCRYTPFFATGKEEYLFERLVAFGDDLLNAISNEEDFAIISGDIYNFYGGDVYSLPYLNENDIILPTYDKTVLSQIENATIVGAIEDNDITQNPAVNGGAVIFNPKLAQSAADNYNFLNFHWDSPTSNDIIEATRLMVITKDKEAGPYVNETIDSCGTELIRRLDIYSDPNTPTIRETITRQWYEAQSSAEPSTVRSLLSMTLALAQFDWAPQMHMFYNDATVTPAEKFYLGSTWDVDVYGCVASQYLAQIHNACLMSLFEIGSNKA